MSLLFSTGLMKWRLCIAIAEPQQSYPAAKKPETDADTARDTAFGPSRPEIPAKKPETDADTAFGPSRPEMAQFACRDGPERLS